jgi:3-oxoacyl-[acyl-carrier-protein] synthase-3
MGAKAAAKAIEAAGIDRSAIDLVIGTTVSGDFTTPSMACMAAHELGITGAACFDVNAACAGFVYALDLVEMHLASGRAKCALIISSEMLSRLTDYTDRSSCCIFADGAGACVVQASDKMYESYLSSEPEGAHRIFAQSAPVQNPFTHTDKFEGQDELFGHGNGSYIFMEGREVYKFATRTMPEAVEQACKKAGIAVADLDVIIPHQANLRIVQTAAKNLGISMDKCYMNIDRYGNTSSACIPIGISDCMESGVLQPGRKVCIVGFGAGLVYAASVFEW